MPGEQRVELHDNPDSIQRHNRSFSSNQGDGHALAHKPQTGSNVLPTFCLESEFFASEEKQMRRRKSALGQNNLYWLLCLRCHNANMHLQIRRGVLVLILSLLAGCSAAWAVETQKRDSPKADEPTADKRKADPTKPPKTVYDYTLVGLDGKETPLSSFNGKVLLIVNLASQSAYRDQIDALQQLQKTYADQGLVVIGVPSADFGGEELKDPDALRKYYRDTAKVSFPVFALASLRGVNEIPLYRFLTDPKAGVSGGDIHWNFTKVLVDRKGVPLARFEVDQDPVDPDFEVTIESALAGKLKKKQAAKDDKGGGDDGDDDDE